MRRNQDNDQWDNGGTDNDPQVRVVLSFFDHLTGLRSAREALSISAAFGIFQLICLELAGSQLIQVLDFQLKVDGVFARIGRRIISLGRRERKQADRH